jgi:uncharacterized protein with HEPN domain
MSRRDPLVYVDDAVAACRAVMGFVDGIDEETYARDLMMRSAVERQMTILSEALTRLLDVAPRTSEGWRTEPREVIAFRNRIVHEYDGLDDAEVLRIAQTDVPVLLRDLENSTML